MGKFKHRHQITDTQLAAILQKGCPLCKDTIELVNQLACPSCDVTIVDMHDLMGATRARNLGVKSVPAVAINGKLADCCTGSGPNEAMLRKAGLGVSM